MHTVFVVLCFVVVMQSFIMNSNEVFIHIHQVCFAGTGAIVRLPQCQWSKPDGYGKISQCITTTKHSKEKTVCIFPGIYCIIHPIIVNISILQLTQGLMITWSYTYFTGCNLHRVTQFFLFLSIIYIYICVCVCYRLECCISANWWHIFAPQHLPQDE